MAQTPTDRVRALLCDQPYWTWDPNGESRFTFRPDGTGVFFHGDLIETLRPWISAFFTWHVDAATASDAFTLTYRLTPRAASLPDAPLSFPPDWPALNAAYLEAAAFEDKTLTGRLERGVFRTPAEEGGEWRGGATLPYTTTPLPRYGMRLTTDASLYPAREQWKQQGWRIADERRIYERQALVGGELSAAERAAAERRCAAM